jgi:hypothetical protein
MGELARDIAIRERKRGEQITPIMLLKKHGLTRHQADAAHHLAKIDIEEFEIHTGQDRPPAPTSVVKRFRDAKNFTPWRMLINRRGNPFTCVAYVRSHAPERLAQSLSNEEKQEAIRRAESVIRWLQQFIRVASKP